MKIYAVLLAAGIGSRTGFSIPKQLVKIKNKEIILHSLDIFLNSKINFDAVIITVPPASVFDFNWGAFFKENLSGEKNKKLKVTTGGESRQQSVYNAVKYLENIYISKEEAENAVVFIHDSARPFVTDKELSLLLDKTAEHGAAFLCSGVTETVKEICDKGIITDGIDRMGIADAGGIAKSGMETANPAKFKTLRRKNLISAKTPQTFKFEIIKRALYKAAEENFISTDDVSLVENLGLTAAAVKSTDLNVKITSALDIEIAELFLEKFKEIR